MNTRFILPILLLGTVSLSADSVPLLQWNFNEGGGDFSINSGSAGPADLYLVSPNGDKGFGFTPDAQGVSGKAGDYAFDLNSATGMGATTPNSGGPAGVVWTNATGTAALSGLSSFTLTGWLKPDVNINRAARIIVAGPIALMAGTEDRLTLQVNGTVGSEQSQNDYAAVGSWIFFAVTYDGTRDMNNVTFYVGSPAAGSLFPAGTTTLAAGKLKAFAGQLLVGNNATAATASRPFKGLMDNLAIYASPENATGALTVEQIEAVRAAAVR